MEALRLGGLVGDSSFTAPNRTPLLDLIKAAAASSMFTEVTVNKVTLGSDSGSFIH
jgi:hypothetical protein